MQLLLAINVGSSTLKFALFKPKGNAPEELARGSFKNIRQSHTAFKFTLRGHSQSQPATISDHKAAVHYLTEWIKSNIPQPVDVVVHRLVHGGPAYFLPVQLTPTIIKDLESYIPLAPNHLPHALQAIERLQQVYTGILQIACFDTAFHQHMPPVAKTLPVDTGNNPVLRRYGFHGLSYEYIYSRLAALYPAIKTKKIILAHLGNGASMAAVVNGTCIDTTMGFTPTGGLLMGSRTGDTDPGLLLYLLQQKQYTAAQLNDLVNHRGGLKGISGISSDMQTLLEQAPDSPLAQLAIDMFCYTAKKQLGAYMAAMDGADIIVFTGGIGDAAPAIRKAICSGLNFAGIQLDEGLNNQNAALISGSGSTVNIHVLKTNEEEQMAAHAFALLQNQSKP